MRKPWLWLPPQLAHDIVPWALPVASALFAKPTPEYKPFSWRGLHFANRLGIAGGVDKAGDSLLHWQKLGTGFLEVGTVTPLAQSANPGKILARDLNHQAVWNKMGFPNRGAGHLHVNLQRTKQKLTVPLFVNIGKNRNTSNEHASQDYVRCMEVLAGTADAFVINISSPNTQGLRQLQTPAYLKSFLAPIFEFKSSRNLSQPVLVKLSPDLNDEELANILDVTLDFHADGWILTNTTSSRPAGIKFSPEGGLSGAPLKDLSLNILRRSLVHLGSRRKNQLIISVGGVLTSADVEERIRLGADLVQIYSALIFKGPLFFLRTLADLRASL